MESTPIGDLVEEREEMMVFPSERSQETHLLKLCLTSIDGSGAVPPHQNRSESSPDLKVLILSVSFVGWRLPSKNFKSWARKMAALHEPTWRKAGIYEAIKASTYIINKDADLLLGMAEKWCPETNTFVFPWGETTITLEDVMVLLGFSVLGLPVFATLDSSEKMKMQRNLENEWVKIKKDKVTFVSQVAWMKRFMGSGDELEHAAFLTLWLCSFVFPLHYYSIPKTLLPIAIHLSSGTRIALAPAVLAHLYSELSLLKTHIRAFTKSPVKMELGSLFKLVQVWTWERFKELQPKPNPILKFEPRLARWCDLKERRSSQVLEILENSQIKSIEWRPYTKPLENWKFPQFYPEKAMSVSVCPDLDDKFISFARCIRVSELVGVRGVEHYFPNRVASQFGILHNVPSPVNRNKLSKEEAWDDYNKPIDALTLYIPSRSTIPCVTPTFSEWWKKSFPGFQDSPEVCVKRRKHLMQVRDTRRKYTKNNNESSMGHFLTQVPSDNDDDETVSRNEETNETGGDASEPLAKKSRLEADNNDSGRPQKLALINRFRIHVKHVRDKRRKHLKQARGKRHKHMKQVPSDNEDEDDDSLTTAQMRLGKKKYSKGDASEPLGKTCKHDANNNDPSPHQKLASIGANGDKTAVSRNEETNETGSKIEENVFLSPFDENNASDGANVDIGVSPPETRKTCNDEFDVYGSNEDMINDGSKEPKCLLQEDGAMGVEKGRSNETFYIEVKKEVDTVDDDSLIQKKLVVEELTLKACSCQKLAAGGANGDESNTWDPPIGFNGANDIVVPRAEIEKKKEETPKSNVQLEIAEKRNKNGNDSYGKSLHEVKMIAASLEERINTAQRKVAWLKERNAMKQRKLAAASLI